MTGRLPMAFVKWTASALFHSALIRPVAAAVDRVGRPVFQILSYHRVNDDGDPFFPSLPTRVFESQMAYVVRNYTVLTVEDLVERLRRGRLPRNAVAITFDDGYRDNLTQAAPILARYGLPATIFLATGFVGTGEVPWFDRLAFAVKTSAADAVAAPWGEPVGLGDRDCRLRLLARVLDHFKRQPDEARRRQLEPLLAALGVDDRRAFRNLMLSWEDVHGLTHLGFSVGAHTVNHPILSRVSAERARTEILGAHAMIASVCGAPPRAFAYPNGRPEDYNRAVVNMVRDAGFTCAVTTIFGVNHSGIPPYELRRGGPWEHHLPTFAAKLAAYRLVGAWSRDVLVDRDLPATTTTTLGRTALRSAGSSEGMTCCVRFGPQRTPHRLRAGTAGSGPRPRGEASGGE